MNTTDKYIEMCEKATELQREIQITNCGFRYIKNYVYYGIFGGNDGVRDVVKKTIWLPRQEQLQEIWLNRSDNSSSILSMIDCFNNFIINSKETLYLCSMEQLWLAFIMKEKYNKTWNGENWNE
jgi:hypothetical protein